MNEVVPITTYRIVLFLISLPHTNFYRLHLERKQIMAEKKIVLQETREGDEEAVKKKTPAQHIEENTKRETTYRSVSNATDSSSSIYRLVTYNYQYEYVMLVDFAVYDF